MSAQDTAPSVPLRPPNQLQRLSLLNNQLMLTLPPILLVFTGALRAQTFILLTPQVTAALTNSLLTRLPPFPEDLPLPP